MIKLEERGVTSKHLVAVCDSCDRFCDAEGGTIAHANYCDGGKRTERWVPTIPKIERAIENTIVIANRTIDSGLPLNTVGNGNAEDEWHAVHSRNPKDWDRAMNRDD